MIGDDKGRSIDLILDFTGMVRGWATEALQRWRWRCVQAKFIGAVGSADGVWLVVIGKADSP